MKKDLQEGPGPFATTPTRTHLQSNLPKPWPRDGQSGEPNQAGSMTASRMMQQTSTEEDIEYWMGDPDDPDDKGATFDPPYNLSLSNSSPYNASKDKISEVDSYLNSMNESIIRKIVQEIIIESINQEEMDEVSAIGGGAMGMAGEPSGQVRGHTGPLGSDNRSPKLKKDKKKKKKSYEPSMRAFGGASEVD